MQLDPPDLAMLRSLHAVYEQHRLIAEVFKQQIEQAIYLKYGVDLVEEPWTLDLERGCLTHDQPD